MPRKKTIRVRAAEGKRLPLPAGTVVNNALSYVTAETPAEVIHNSFIRRRIAAGNLVEDRGETQRATADRPQRHTKPFPPTRED